MIVEPAEIGQLRDQSDVPALPCRLHLASCTLSVGLRLLGLGLYGNVRSGTWGGHYSNERRTADLRNAHVMFASESALRGT